MVGLIVVGETFVGLTVVGETVVGLNDVGEIYADEDRRLAYKRANRLWHTDSIFRHLSLVKAGQKRIQIIAD